MADTNAESSGIANSSNHLHIIPIVWGTDIKLDVFQRWSQGFAFSTDESTALLQFQGGPCAVIAPVQAALLKNLIFTSGTDVDWRDVSDLVREDMLINSLKDIMVSARTMDDSFVLVTHCPSNMEENGPETIENDDSESCPKKPCLDHEHFHNNLKFLSISTVEELQNKLKENFSSFKKDYGILLYLYSVLLSKGIKQINNEIEDINEPLIDGVYGHASQSLINLMLTGKAVSHVWDHEKELMGLRLKGISDKSQIGFLTLLEHLRYCEVGWNYKDPFYPIWILGSETHLSVIFSLEKSLVGDNSPGTIARRTFNQFDSEARGFISAEVLGDILQALDLESDPEYVKIIEEKMDPEKLGIITWNAFMDEFFPGEECGGKMKSFTLYHYNGLQGSCPNRKVVYQIAEVILMDAPELQIVTDTSPIKLCLMTKWPTLELQWKNNTIPSLN